VRGVVGVGEGIAEGVEEWVAVLVGVAEYAKVFVEEGVGVKVAVTVGLMIQKEFPAFGLPRIRSPLASWPMSALPSYVPQAEELSGTTPNLSMDDRGSLSPPGHAPAVKLAVSTVSPEGPSRDKDSPPSPKAPE